MGGERDLWGKKLLGQNANQGSEVREMSKIEMLKMGKFGIIWMPWKQAFPPNLTTHFLLFVTSKIKMKGPQIKTKNININQIRLGINWVSGNPQPKHFIQNTQKQ